MTNIAFTLIEYYDDIDTVNTYNEMVRDGSKPEDALRLLQPLSRDNARTPMQWSSEKNAGFTKGKPWLGINPNYKEINVLEALRDESSIFNYYRKLINLRKQNLTIVYGNYVPILEDDNRIYAYLRCLDKDRLLVILNFCGETSVFRVPVDIKYRSMELLISNYNVDEEQRLESLILRPYEARVYRLYNS